MSDHATSGAGGCAERVFKVLNQKGLHARPAALLVKTANQFDSDIVLVKDGNEVSAKSIISVLTLEGYMGAVIEVRADGHDSTEAMDALQELFDSKFHEE